MQIDNPVRLFLFVLMYVPGDPHLLVVSSGKLY